MLETEIDAEHTEISSSAELAPSVSIAGIGGPCKRLIIGDHVELDDSVRVRTNRLIIGDFTRIHRNTTIYGHAGCHIGHNVWCGENVTINCNQPLSIGDNVVLSTGCSLWTHFAGGDVVAGCRFDEAGAVTVGKDAWVGVDASIGLSDVGEKTLVTAGSVVTDDLPENRVYGGTPAEDITEQMGGPPFRELDCGERLAKLESLLSELNPDEFDLPAFGFTCGGDSYRFDPATGSLETTDREPRYRFDLESRTYEKTGESAEAELIKALLPRAKFTPE